MCKLIRNRIQAAKMYFAKWFGYVVWSAEYNAVHCTMSYAEAREWQACYTDAVIVYAYAPGCYRWI